MDKTSKQISLEGVDNKPLKPLIKWAGGKTRLNQQLLKVSNLALKSLEIKKFNYYEPFFGGGALFLELHKNRKIKSAHVNDIIPHLVSFYETVAKEEWLNVLFNEIESLTNTFEEGDQKEVYGSAKKNSGWVKEFNDLWMGKHPKTKQEKIKSAALFFVLNKTGFNGMFRLNKEGKFNIPKGDTNKISFDAKVKDNFRDISLLLSQTTIHLGSYKKLLPPENEIDKKTSFIYLDPPYIPDSKTADFTDYSKEGFDEKDHKQVADIFHQLAQDGYMVVLSNNSNDDAKEMYAKNNKAFAYEVDVSRAIAKIKEGKRPPSKELLVSSFNLSDLGMKRI
jgi:DNA adenine methylase